MSFTISLSTGLVMLLCLQCVSTLPTGRESSSNSNSEMISELKEKLQRLHDILQSYDDAKGVSEPTKTPLDQGSKYEQNGNTQQTSVNDTPTNEPQKQQQKLESQETPVSIRHPSPRALKSEDMRRISERDSDEMELEHLGNNKVKRGQEQAVQILAKALAHLKDFPSNDKTDDTTEEHARNLESESKAKDDDWLAANGQTMEAFIMEALKKLDNGEIGGKREKESIAPLPLFHGKKDKNTRMVKKESYKSQQASMPDVLVKELYSQGQRDSNDDGYTNEEILKALMNAGYVKDEQVRRQIGTKSQVLGDVETKLMEDIQRANEVGVSVKDLIDDLEDKAFKEAILRRIKHLVDPR